MDEVALPDLRLKATLGYLDFLNLMANARLVLTDQGAEGQRSGGTRGLRGRGARLLRTSWDGKGGGAHS